MSTKSDKPVTSSDENSDSSDEQDKLEMFEEFIEAIPEPQRQEARSLIQKEFHSHIERSGISTINPEVAKILVESQDKDNEHKFQFLTQKQKDDADEALRRDTFKEKKHDNHFSLIKPIIFVVLFVVVGSTAIGLYFCYVGKEALGAALLAGIWGAVFGYLAGFGTSNFFKNNT